MSFILPDLIYNPPLEPYLSIVYQDDDIIVLDKPSGLLSVPGRDPALFDSIASRVREKFPQAQMINRLDKDTSGLILVALNKKAHGIIAKQFEARTTEKSYIAIVFGHVTEDEGIVDLPIAIDWENKPLHQIDYKNGKASQTKWQVLERLPAFATRMQLTPLTGRTHQLRVHMKALGHSILGDVFYSEGEALAAAPRLMLHAEKLAFTHANGEYMSFIAPCPF